MIWEIKTEVGWSGLGVHTDPGTTRTEAFEKAFQEVAESKDGHEAVDVRWTCEEVHSYFVRGFKPIFKNSVGTIIDTTIWKIKEDKLRAEAIGEIYTGADYAGQEFEIECWLCSDKYFTDTDLAPDRPLHPLCIRGEHFWDIPCQCCHPGEIWCGRRPFCGTVKTAEDFREPNS